MPEVTAIRVVVFTGGPSSDPQVMEFLSRLDSDPTIALVGVFSQSPQRGWRAVAKDLWKRRGLLAAPLLIQALGRVLWVEVASPGRARRGRALARQLESRMHHVADIHDSRVIERVRALEPALGLVYGGPIVKPALFEIPTRGTLGIHHGKVPEYRGKKTTFWAVHNGEREVGVTIQRIGRRLDGGDVVMQRCIPVGRRPLPVIKRELERVGLDLYIHAIHAVRDGSAIYRRQRANTSRLYKDPNAWDITRFWCRYVARLFQH